MFEHVYIYIYINERFSFPLLDNYMIMYNSIHFDSVNDKSATYIYIYIYIYKRFLVYDSQDLGYSKI